MAEEKMDQFDSGDPELSAAFRAALGETPATDWRALEARIADAARFRLAARRPATWRTATSRWARVAVPVGLAASALLGIGLAMRAAEDDVFLEDIVATAAVDALPPEVASLGGESLFYALFTEGE